MKKFMVNFVIDAVYDMLIMSLRRLAMRSNSSVDDELVSVFADNKDEVIADLKRHL